MAWSISIDNHTLKWTLEYVFRMLHDVWVDGGVDTNQDAERVGSAASGTPCLMSMAELVKAEEDLTGLVSLNYIRKRKELLEAEPTETTRNTGLALLMVAGLSVMLITVAFLVPVIASHLT